MFGAWASHWGHRGSVHAVSHLIPFISVFSLNMPSPHTPAFPQSLNLSTHPSVDLELLNWRLLSLNRSGELGRSGSVERPGGSGERSGGGRDSVQRTEDGGWADHNVCSMSLEVCMSGELCEKPEKQQV